MIYSSGKSFRNHPFTWALGGLCALGAAACNRAEAAGRQRKARDDSAIVVAYGNESFSLADVEAPIAHQLFELRSAAAQDLVLSAVLKDEAAKRGISVGELIRSEVERKVTAPTQAELERVYEQEKLHDKSGTLPSLEELKPQLTQQLQRAERQLLEQRFMTQLLERADLRMNLDALGRPEHKTRAGGPSRGPEHARVRIVEYTDFTSRFCAMAQPTVEKLLATYPKEVRFEFRQAPEPGNELARTAAQAALCADDQGRYWDYRKLLFAEQAKLSPAHVRELAQRLGLDGARFESCLADGEKAKTIDSDWEETTSQGLEGSPVFSLNGTRLSGAHPFETFERLIRMELRKAPIGQPRRASL